MIWNAESRVMGVKHAADSLGQDNLSAQHITAAGGSASELGDISSPLALQVGGDHYKSMPIQPVEFALLNRLNTAQANIVKYVCRYPKKGGAADLEKAHHYCDIWLQVYSTYGLDWNDMSDQVVGLLDTIDSIASGQCRTVDVATFVQANNLPPTVGRIVELTCVNPSPERIDVAKTLIQDLLAETK
jgi:hypothetical protein